VKLGKPFPPLYPILDVGCLPDRELKTVIHFAEELAAAGCTLLQYRNKVSNPREILAQARELRRLFADRLTLIMNDRADLTLVAGFDGVHVGQDDLTPEAARQVIGREFVLGVSTHNPEQLAEAGATSADYVAIGPVFTTSTKMDPDPVVGLEGVRAVRALTSKPLVAIGGIMRANAGDVIRAGADSVAVIADLLASPRKSAEEFLKALQ
jgi:thiamine-phosphate pyrophosphorylase